MTSALSRETPTCTKGTPETAETHDRRETPEMAIGEDRRDSETAEVDQCWSVMAGIGQWCSAMGAVACSAVFDADTVREL